MNFDKLVRVWNRLSVLPGGKQVFSRSVGFFVPYTGSLGALVEELEPGHTKVRLRDRRAVRNHLSSVHAMALANLGEMATGIALNTALPGDARAILTGFNIQYTKKGRGDLTAEARVPKVDAVPERKTFEVVASIRDSHGEEIAKVTAQWLAGPRKESE
jgi:acyl-coenzyme A thioesterase PaaI-like protein